jgi:hypothetical protein
MKIRNFVVVFMVSCIANLLTAEQVWLKSEYPTPVTVYLNGNPIKTFQKDDKTPFQLLRWGDNITFKVGSNPVPYYLAFKKEVQKIANAFKQNPNFVATITILNTGNKLDFDYNTSIQFAPTKNVPTTPTPESRFMSDRSMTPEEYLNIISQNSNYGNLSMQVRTLQNHFTLANNMAQKGLYNYPQKLGAHPYKRLLNDLKYVRSEPSGLYCPFSKEDLPEKRCLELVTCLVKREYDNLLEFIQRKILPPFPTDV